MSTPVLSDSQIGELRKVFALGDSNADGFITASELALMIENIARSKPTQAEIDQLMAACDKNKDGHINWEEFKESIVLWMQKQDAVKVVRNRKRKLEDTPNEVRQKMHKTISNFFFQFRRTGFESEEKYESESTRLDDEDIVGISFDLDVVYSSEEKAKRLKMCKEYASKIQDIAEGMSSNDQNVALGSVKALAQVFSICEVYRTPMERYEIAGFLIGIFKMVMEAGLIQRIAQFLTVNENPELQYESTKFIILFCNGPRIANTPSDSILHPSKMYHKSEVIKSNVLHALMNLLRASLLSVQQEAVVAIGKIACYDPPARDLCLSLQVLPVFCQMVAEQTPLSLVQRLSWAISILCGHTHSRQSLPPLQLVAPGLERLSFLMFKTENEETLLNACCGISYLLLKMKPTDQLSQKLIQLLSCPYVRVQRIILETMVDILRLDHVDVVQILHFGLLKEVRKLLESKHYPIRLAAIDLLSLIAGEKNMVQAVENDIIPGLITILFNDDFLRCKAVKIIRFATQASPQYVKDLVQRHDIVRVLSEALSHFKSYDPVLRDVYHFLGPSFNFEFVHDVLGALENIIFSGQVINSAAASSPTAASPSTDSANAYTKYFDMALVDKIKLILTVLSEEPDSAHAWRSRAEDGTSLEDRIRALLHKIQRLHETEKTQSAFIITKTIAETLKRFDETLAKNMKRWKRDIQRKKKVLQLRRTESDVGMKDEYDRKLDDSMKVKLFFHGDNRVMGNCTNDIKLKELRTKIQLAYGRSGLILQYEDEEGDKISIDSQATFEKALKLYREGSVQSLKIYLLESDSLSLAPPVGVLTRTHSQRNLMFEDLASKTSYSKQDLNKLWKQFQKSSVNGRVNKEQFAAGLGESGITDELMTEQLFHAFDVAKDGTIDFREFVVGLSVISKGSMEDRLRLVFNSYDLNGNGKITKPELFQILCTTFDIRGFTMTNEQVQDMVDKCFDDVDEDGDDALDFAEFKQAVLKHKIAIQSFWSINV